MLKRLTIVVGLAVLAGTLWCAPAAAEGWWGSVQCGNAAAQPGCDLTAGHTSGAPDSRPQPLQNPKPNNTNLDSTTDGLDTAEDKPATIHCSYVRSDYRPPIATAPSLPSGPPLVAQPAAFIRPTTTQITPRAVAEPDPGQHGAWYVYKCDGPGAHDAVYRSPIWIPDGQQPSAAQLPSPAKLAQQARSQFRLPAAHVVSSPSGVQIVRVPTWLWLPPSSWGTRSATASVPGLAVTATAAPTTVTWTLGDGSTITCHAANWRGGER